MSAVEGEIASKPRKKRFFSRGCVVLILGLTLCILCFAALIAVTWSTGHLKNYICSNTLQNSPIYNRLNCDTSTGKTVQNGGYSINVVEEGRPQPSNTTIDVSDIYEKSSMSVVGIGVKGQDLAQSQIIGSGFVVSASGLIATNQHVVSYTNEEYYIKFNESDELVDVTEIYRDPINDIAILKVTKTDLTALTLGNSDNLKPGQPVVAIGNPLGKYSSTVTSGIISGLNREVSVGSDTFLRSSSTSFKDVIQTDAAINPGNSGGPLLNAAGEVVGINFATAQGYDNLSFALPVSLLRIRLAELQQKGKFSIPYLGVEYSSRLISVGKQVLVGAQITNIDPKGGAVNVLKVGDVVVEFAGKSLEDNSLSELIQKSQVGQQVELTVVRAKEKLVLTVTIGERS